MADFAAVRAIVGSVSGASDGSCIEVAAVARSAVPAEAEMARASEARISAGLDKGATLKLSIDGGDEGTSVPSVVAQLVLDILGELARGHAVSISGIEGELSVEQTAKLINTS